MVALRRAGDGAGDVEAAVVEGQRVISGLMFCRTHLDHAEPSLDEQVRRRVHLEGDDPIREVGLLRRMNARPGSQRHGRSRSGIHRAGPLGRRHDPRAGSLDRERLHALLRAATAQGGRQRSLDGIDDLQRAGELPDRRLAEADFRRVQSVRCEGRRHRILLQIAAAVAGRRRR